MTDLNSFTATGRLTGNAELKYTTNGTACTKFGLAINKSYKKDGAWEDKAHFFSCVIWGKYGESMHKHLTKGKQIAIEAELNHTPWKDNNDNLHNDVVINVKNITLLSSPKNQAKPESENNPAPAEMPAAPEDIPF
ncbi:single-stranded DNA-binding protein [Treponema sp.]|uniref:single-stranded DNA-binding protein n=1 Tax=Treponema sp. TaxID=166 RepID=UPI003FA26F33